MRGEWCSQKIKDSKRRGKKRERNEKTRRTELAGGFKRKERARHRERESCVHDSGHVSVCLGALYRSAIFYIPAITD